MLCLVVKPVGLMERREREKRKSGAAVLSQRGQVDLSPRNGGSRGVCVKLLFQIIIICKTS